jgi:hypothetical protein
VRCFERAFQVYLEAGDYAFGGNVEYARLVKIYGADSEAEKRCTGGPSPKHIGSGWIERKSLSLRMSDRRLICPTKAFSEKIEEPRRGNRPRLVRIQLNQNAARFVSHPHGPLASRIVCTGESQRAESESHWE